MSHVRDLGSPVKFWSSDLPEWNFGDALTLLLMDELFYDLDCGDVDIRLIGSTLADGLVPTTAPRTFEDLEPWRANASTKVVFWGCGIREPGSLSDGARADCDILAVRGPLSASDLRLGAGVPQGEPGLLLPALYTPRTASRFAGKSVCIPHFNDRRSDLQFLAETGCDLVLRPNLRPDRQAVLEFVDAVHSADFVLCAALHGAVTAAAYGKPFAYWDNGELDLPFKWDDFSALIGIAPRFAKTLEEARDVYARETSATIRLPSLWPMLMRAPLLLREKGVVGVLKHELASVPDSERMVRLEQMLNDVRAGASRFEGMTDRLARFHRARDRRLTDEVRTQAEKAAAALDALAVRSAEVVDLEGRLRAAVEEGRAGIDAARRLADEERTTAEREAEALRRAIAEVEARVAEAGARLDETIRAASDERAAAQREIDGLRHAIREKEIEAEESRTRLDAVSGDYERALADLRRDLDLAVQKASQDGIEAEGRIETLRAQLAEAESQTAELKASTTRAADERRGLEERAARAESARETAEAALRAMTSEHETLRRETAELAEKAAQGDASAEALRRDLSAAQDECRSLSWQAREASLSLASREAERARMEGMAQALTGQMKRRIRQSRSLTGRALGVVGLGSRVARSIREQSAVIEAFLDEFGWPLVGVAPDGREERILRYLMGLTDHLADFPFLRNVEYLDMYPDVANSGMSPLTHYIKYGRKEERNVHPLLDTHFYLNAHPEARHAASCPALHYLTWGMQKGFDPHPLFKTNDYRMRYADVGSSGRNPLLHWLDNDRCVAHPLFDATYYLERNPDVARAGRNPLTHYLAFGWREGRNPHPFFDTNYYLSANPDVRDQGVNPLIHYVGWGYREGRRATPLFDPGFYLATYPDIADGRIDPLLHYVEHGAREGRLPVRPPASQPPAPTPEATRPVALMIDALFPRPDQDSGSLDQISFVKIFQALGYEVHFLSVLEFGASGFGDNRAYIKNLTDLGVKCIRSNDYDFIESYLFLNNDRIEVVFASRVDFGGAYVSVARELCPRASIVFNTVDLHFIREEREAALKNDPAIHERARATRDKELALATSSDAVVVVSETEKRLLAEIAPKANVVVVPLIREFPSGAVAPFEARSDIAFVGGFLHQPNIDAVDNFLATIWPRVHALRPDLRFRVIGSNMSDEMRQRVVPGVDFVGYVAELEPELARIRLTVAPLRYGAGAKGKLVSSLGQGVPSVVSAVAAEGMGLADRREVLVADLDDTFADRIVELYDDPVLWQTLSTNGMTFIRDAYSLDAGRDIVSRLLADLSRERRVAS